MKKILSFLIMMSVYVPLFSQATPDFSLFEKKEYNHDTNKILPYRILYPENYDKNQKYPLLLFLHGAGERGSDNEKQLAHGATLFLKEENRKKFPAIVVFPQCPEDSYWSSVEIARDTMPLSLSFNYNNSPTWPLVTANELIKKIMKEDAVNPAKVYITGLSMGGMGTFEAVYHYPELYAAAAPICGGGDTKMYDERVKQIPFWVFHGDEDGVVDVDLSRQMVERLKAINAVVKYTEYAGVNHNSWDNAFAEPDYLKWLFSQEKK